MCLLTFILGLHLLLDLNFEPMLKLDDMNVVTNINLTMTSDHLVL